MRRNWILPGWTRILISLTRAGSILPFSPSVQRTAGSPSELLFVLRTLERLIQIHARKVSRKMRRLEEYSLPHTTLTIFTLVLPSRSPFIFTFPYHSVSYSSTVRPYPPVVSIFLLLRHSPPTKWAPRESWNMLTFTDRCKGRRENEGRGGTRPQRLRSARFYWQTCPRQLSNF